MDLLPNTVLLDFEEETEELEETTDLELGRTPLFDFEQGCYVFKDGKVVECTREEAIKQWVGFLIKTPAEKFDVYEDTEFGTYIHNLLSYKDMAFIASEVERELEEKSINNRAIAGLSNFECTKDGGKLTIAFDVIDAEEETESGVVIDVY